MLEVQDRTLNCPGRQFSYRKTFVNLLSQWVTTIAGILINLYLVAYLATKLGKDLYGAWAGILSIVSFLMLLDSGLSSAVQQHTATAYKFDDSIAHRRTYTVATMLYAMLAIVAVAVGYLITLGYAKIFPSVPASIAVAIRPAIVWAGISVGLILLSVPARGFLLGTQRFALGNFFQVLQPATMLVFLMVMFSWKGVRPVYLGQGLAASALLALVGSHTVVWTRWPSEVRPLMRGIKAEMKGLLSFTTHSLTWSVAQMVIFRASPLFALWFLSPADAAYTYVVMTAIQTARGLVVAGSAIAAPMSAALPEEQLRPLVLRGTRATALLIAVISGFALVYGRTFFELWLKSADLSIALAFQVFSLGLIASMPNWWSSILSAVLIGTKQLQAETKVMVARVVLTLSMGFGGLRLYGVTGLIVGLALGNSLACCVGYATALCRHLRLSVRQLLADTIPVNVGLWVLILLVGMLCLHLYHPTNWLGMLVHALTVFLLVLPVLWLWGIDSSTRAKVLAWRPVSVSAR